MSCSNMLPLVGLVGCSTVQTDTSPLPQVFLDKGDRCSVQYVQP